MLGVRHLHPTMGEDFTIGIYLPVVVKLPSDYYLDGVVLFNAAIKVCRLCLSVSLFAAWHTHTVLSPGQTGVCPCVLPWGGINLHIIPPYGGMLFHGHSFVAFDPAGGTPSDAFSALVRLNWTSRLSNLEITSQKM